MTTSKWITQQDLQQYNDYKELVYCMDNGESFPTSIFANDCIYSMNSVGYYILKFNHKAFN